MQIKSVARHRRGGSSAVDGKRGKCAPRAASCAAAASVLAMPISSARATSFADAVSRGASVTRKQIHTGETCGLADRKEGKVVVKFLATKK